MKSSSFRRLLLTKAGVDDAVGYTAAGKATAAVMGAGNLFCVLRFLRPEEQGFYYTFTSVLSLLSLLGFGLGGLIVHFASHERAHLRWNSGGTLEGDPTPLGRLRSLTRKTTVFYVLAAAGGVLPVLAIGQALFSGTALQHLGISWRGPWTMLCLCGALSFSMMPLLSVAEGAGLVAEVARMRFWQVVAAHAALWAMLAGRLGLWAPAGSALAALLVQAGWAVGRRSRLFRDLLLKSCPGAAVSWRRELLPVQCRASAAGLSAYLASQAANPVLLRLRGPAVAGRFGVTVNMTLTCLAVGAAWSNTKWPLFGSLIFRRRFEELDALFWKGMRQSLAVLALLGGGLLGFVWTLQTFVPAYGGRLLPLGLVGVAYLQMLAAHVVTNLGAYCRAHKEESLFGLRIFQGAASASCTALFGWTFGVTGVVWSNALLMLIFVTPAAWEITRRRTRFWRASAWGAVVEQVVPLRCCD
jgi:hypothetical protein